jgi:hypothetical protein
MSAKKIKMDTERAKPRANAPNRKGLSLHPLDVETALGAALQTGRVTDETRAKKSVDKSRQSKRS